jgi:anti-sigma factor RsiW
MSELVTAFVDGELSEPEVGMLTQRIGTDPIVRRLVAIERATKHLVATRMTRHGAPAALRQRILIAIFGKAGTQKARGTMKQPYLWWLLTNSPATASLIGGGVLVALLVAVLMLFSGERITPYIDDVYAHHTQVERFPVGIEGSYEAVAAETAEAVGFPVPVPHLGDQFALRGARRCTLCGHLMAYVKYRGDEALVSFFIIPGVRPAIWRLEKHTSDAMSFYTAHHDTLQMAFWRQEGTMYCLAAVLSEEDVVGLAATAREQVSVVLTATVPVTTAAPALIARHRALSRP